MRRRSKGLSGLENIWLDRFSVSCLDFMDRLILAGRTGYAIAMPMSSADLRVGGNALLKSVAQIAYRELHLLSEDT